MPKKILIPVPSCDFDPTEAAIPWKIFSENGIQVQFATPDGLAARADERMLTGRGLFLFKPFLMAARSARGAYAAMEDSPEFKKPISWDEIDVENFDGLILPGGHAPGMKAYLESKVLMVKAAEFSSSKKPVGAICHGVVLAARSGILHGRKTTALLASQELLAWILTVPWLGRYYRTYTQTVEAEVRSALLSSEDFLKGPAPLLRDDPAHLNRGFVVRDGNYLSARWPGDAHLFANEFVKMLN